MLEKEVEQAVVDHAKKTGWVPLKITPFGDRGWPDRIFLAPRGVNVWMELKAPGKKPRKLQLYRLTQLANMGFRVGWFDNATDAIAFLDATRLSATGNNPDAETVGSGPIS